MLPAWSVVFGVLAVTPMALIALRLRWGWLAGLGTQVPWTVYDLVTHQPGFLLITAVQVPVCWYGWAHHNQREPGVTAGEITYRAWCPQCQAPTRLRVDLHTGTTPVPVAVLEMCAECGRGYLPQRPLVQVRPLAALRPVLAVRWWLARHIQARHGRPARGCAYKDCPRPGWWNCAHITRIEDGTVRYLFCGARHRRAWARDQWHELGVT